MKNRLILFFLLCFIFPFYCYSTEPVKVQLLSATKGVGNEDSVYIALAFDITPGWKVYGPNETLISEIGYPPKIERHYSKNVNIQDIQDHWPLPEE